VAAAVIITGLGIAAALTGGILGVVLAGAFWGALAGGLIGGASHHRYMATRIRTAR